MQVPGEVLSDAVRATVEAAEAAGDWQRVLAIVGDWKDLPPKELPFWALSAIARARLKQGQFDEASALYDVLSELHPGKAIGWRGKAESASQKGDHFCAELLWRDCIRRFPTAHSLNWRRRLALALAWQGKPEEASAIIKELSELWPNDPASLLGQCELAMVSGDFTAEARAHVQLAMRFPRSVTPTHFKSLFSRLRTLVAPENLSAAYDVISETWPIHRYLSGEADELESMRILRIWISRVQYLVQTGQAKKALDLLQEFPSGTVYSQAALECRQIAESLEETEREPSRGEPGASAHALEEWPAALVWRHPKTSSSVIFVFSNGGDGFFLTLNALIRQLKGLDCHLVFVRDHGKSFYLGDIHASSEGKIGIADSLREIAESLGARSIYCLGISIGGYGALRYGLELRAKAVLGFGALVNPTRLRRVPLQTAYLQRVRQVHPELIIDACDLYRQAEWQPRVTLCYGADHIADRSDAETMCSIPGVRLQPVEGFSDHSVIRWYFSRSLFEPTVREAFFGASGNETVGHG